MAGPRENRAATASWRLGTNGASSGAAGYVAGGVGVGLLAVLAARAVSAAPRATAWFIAFDVIVGLAFIAAAVVAPGPRAERRWIGAAGVAWLAGSFLPVARALHQAVLLIALLAFPTGRVRGVVAWIAVAPAAITLGLPVLPQPAVALVFGVVAVVVLVADRRGGAARWFPAVSAAGVAVAVIVSWVAGRFRWHAIDPGQALLAYQAVLLTTAAAFPFAAAAMLRARHRFADELLADARVEGLEAFAAVLRPALGDPDLQVYRWHNAAAAYVDGDGRPVATGGRDRRWLHVDDDERPVAVVVHRSPALDDQPTADAVTTAVRLAAMHLRLREEEGQQLRELEASRARLVAAADRARERAAGELRAHVDVSLRGARAELDALLATRPRATDALAIVVDELAAATRDIADVIAGVPATRLGGGRLHDALDALARRCSLAVALRITPDAVGDAATEAALFYVCAEALTNAAKHAHGTAIELSLRRHDGALVLAVTDDGRGGADPSGSGLQGLADRVVAHGGRLRVDSRPGAGTTVTATIPG